jgi:hypothetical protein
MTQGMFCRTPLYNQLTKNEPFYNDILHSVTIWVQNRWLAQFELANHNTTLHITLHILEL